MPRIRARPLPPLDALRERLVYNATTGELRWRVSNGRRAVAGAVAGHKRPTGYIFVELDHRSYAAHRIAWALHYGVQPPEWVDHRNGKRDDNRIKNLRAATWQEQCYNRALRKDSGSGVKGVSLVRGARWRATIKNQDGKQQHLGYFDTREEAIAARERAARRLHGDFYREK